MAGHREFELVVEAARRRERGRVGVGRLELAARAPHVVAASYDGGRAPVVADGHPLVVGQKRVVGAEQPAYRAGVMDADVEVSVVTNAARHTLFPAMEAGLIAELVRRDALFYDPAITAETVAAMNRFARDLGILSGPVPYEQVVAPQFRRLWAS